ncbi:MAG TPA: signal peptidase I, partial [Spirochaetota bacterium]|nr:signal peptidase I [Spirochaetota bacterium]
MNIERFITKLYNLSIDHFVHWRRHLREYFWAIVIALTIRAFFFTIYRIPTGSMIPTLNISDTLIANKFYNGLKLPFTGDKPGFRLPAIKKPEVGDIIVFRGNQERWHYYINLEPRNQKAEELLARINRAASFGRPFMISSNKTFTNYIYLNNSYQADIRELVLARSLFNRYKEKFNDSSLFRFFRAKKINRKLGMTFAYTNQTSFLRSFFSTPVAGLSILATVLLKAPYFYPYRALLVFLQHKFSSSEQNYAAAWQNFSLYPNQYVDMTKDLVK